MLSKQLDNLITSMNHEDCKQALLMLQICFKNIDLHPHDDKYRQIKLNNRMFYSRAWQYPAVKEFMKMSGWEIEGAFIKLKDDSYVQIVLQLLKTRLEGDYMQQKGIQKMFTIEEFEALTSAVFAEDIIAINMLLQKSGISNTGRVYCENGSSINLLCAAVTTHKYYVVKFLLRWYNINPYEIDRYGDNQRPCIFQVFHQAPEAFIIKFLSAPYSIDVCVKFDGFTLLHTAVLTNCMIVLSHLFSKDCQEKCLKCTDDKRRTSLHLAYLYGNVEIAEFLLENGADETVLDIYGKKPFDYIKGEPELVAYSQYVQNTRKIHNDPYSIEYNYYIKLLMHGMKPKEATTLTMKEFTWLQEEKPTPPQAQHVKQAIILNDLAHFLVKIPVD